jgi:hypothetical protein
MRLAPSSRLWIQDIPLRENTRRQGPCQFRFPPRVTRPNAPCRLNTTLSEELRADGVRVLPRLHLPGRTPLAGAHPPAL